MRVVRELSILVICFVLAPRLAGAQTAGVLEPTAMGGPITATVTRGASWRVFGVDVDPSQAVTVASVEEVKQQNPPSHFAVSSTNRSDVVVDGYVIAALVVTSDGSVRSIQPLAEVKNLKPGQTRRQQTPLRTVILSESERIAFVPYRIRTGDTSWTVADADMRAAVKRMAQSLPVP